MIKDDLRLKVVYLCEQARQFDLFGHSFQVGVWRFHQQRHFLAERSRPNRLCNWKSQTVFINNFTEVLSTREPRVIYPPTKHVPVSKKKQKRYLQVHILPPIFLRRQSEFVGKNKKNVQSRKSKKKPKVADKPLKKRVRKEKAKG